MTIAQRRIAIQKTSAKVNPSSEMHAVPSQGMGGTAGLVLGETRDELVTALAIGGRRLMFGKQVNELLRMMPHGDEHDVLQVAAEGRLLYGTDMAERLADAIHYRAHLTPQMRPILHLILAELLSNAIEHGNLRMSTERKDLINEQQWFDDYQKRVTENLATPLGRIPILITCRREGSDLEVVIEDRGLGFNVREAMDVVKGADAPTGRGLSLVYALLNNRVNYTNNGRRVSFHLPVRPRAEHSVLPTGNQVREEGRVMIVDDQMVNLKVAEIAFHKNGFKNVKLCNDSRIALQEIREWRPDVLILDIIMPDIDGYTLCGQIKKDPVLKNLPVMFFSGHNDSINRVKGYQLGAVDFVTKPIEPAELVARSEIHLMTGVMMRTLQKFADQMNTDLERAKLFQLDLLPSAMSLMQLAEDHGLDLATSYQGCDTLAGDYWNIFALDNQHVALCLVDFTGHGVLAALNTVQLHTLLHNTPHLQHPVLVAQSLNYHLNQLLETGCFATFVYGVLNTATGELSYAGGGAPPMFVRRSDGKISTLECSGMPLGLDRDIEVLPRKALLKKGDALILTSDAMTDSPHDDGSRWGEDGLRQAIEKLPKKIEANRILNALLDCFYGSVKLPVPDDLTALVVGLKTENFDDKQ